MNNKIIIVIAISIFIIIFLIGYNYIYMPQIYNMENKRVQLEEEIRKNEIAYKIREIEYSIGRFKKDLPDVSDASWLISEVSNKARRSGVELISIRPREIIRLSYYNIIPVEVNLRGSFHSIGKFIEQIENSKELLKVNFLNQRKTTIAQRRSDDTEATVTTEATDKEGNVLTEVEMIITTYNIR